MLCTGAALRWSQPWRAGQHAGRLVREVAGPLGRHHDHRGGAVVLLAAVVEVEERLDDPARVVVFRRVQRPAAHHRVGVVLRVVVAGERDRPQRLLPDAVVVHEARHLHGEALRRRHHAVGEQELVVAGDQRRAGAAAVAGELALRQRAERDDAIRHAGRHRRRGIADRAAHAASTAAPEHVGEPQFLDAKRRGERGPPRCGRCHRRRSRRCHAG